MFKILSAEQILRLADGACIPVDARNRDYQDYLAWVALGNTALPADPPPPPDTRRTEALQALQDVDDDNALPLKLRLLCRALKRVL